MLHSLTAARTTLRSEASPLGSNLSIVQIRQDFSKNLINVLQTGSSNLTLADTNEEAANSQALSTRQSIAVSALALANQSQAERAAAAALISKPITLMPDGGGNPAVFFDVTPCCRRTATSPASNLPNSGQIRKQSLTIF